jgi:hypothetical protein
MKAQKEYEAARRKDLLTRNLSKRAERDELIRTNVLKDVYMAESQRASMEALKRSMLNDKLSKALSEKKRPTRDDLIAKGIVEEDVYDKIMKLDGDEARELLLRMALRGGLWGDQIDKELNEMLGADVVDYDRLERKLSTRPTPDQLRDLNILKMRGSEVNTKFLATRALSKTLSGRPEKEELERVNILGEKVPVRRKSQVLAGKLADRLDLEDLRARGILV